MKKLPIFVLTFLISLLICTFASTQVKAETLTVSVSPTSWVMDVGQSKTFTANASGGAGIYLGYQWYVNGAPQSGATSTFSYTATSAGSFSITVNVTDILVATTSSSPASVTVNSTLVAPTISASTGTVNQGQTSSLTSSAISTGTSPYAYQWLQKAPGASSYSNIGGATSDSYSFVTSGSTTVGVWSFELQVTDAASAVIPSNPVNVTVNAALTVSVSPTSWVMNVEQLKTFNATASGGSGTYTSYQWYVNGAPQSGATSTFSYTATSAGSFSITVNVIDSSGATAPSSPASVTVNTKLMPPTISASAGTVNQGQTCNLTSAISTGTSPYAYQWLQKAPNASSYSNIGGATSDSYSFVTSGSTTVGVWSFELQVTDTTSAVVTSNVVYVTVNGVFVAPTVSASPNTITQGQTSGLTSSIVTTGTAPYTYQWLQKGPGASLYSLISGATSSTYSFITSDSTVTGDWSFILQVTDAAGQAVNSSAVKVTLNNAPVDHFIFSTVSNQIAGTYFEITITAKDASNNTIVYYNGINTLSVSNGTILPIITDTFSDGVWTGLVNVTQAGSEIKLLTSGSSMTGVSNYFTVSPGALDHFSINTVTGTFTNGSSFNITVTAQDAYNNTVTSYIGKPSLAFSAGTISPSVMKAFVKGVGSTLATINATGSNGTILVKDGTYTGISNLLTLNTNLTSIQPVTPYESMLAIGITIPEIILIFTVIASKRLRQKPESS